jgi:hypothetical protein
MIEYQDLINGPSLYSDRFDFKLIPGNVTGGSLATPGAKVLTIRPVPMGVNGTNTDYYLRISGGTGTAETVLVTGGTCVAGASVGTIEFTTVNSHTGSWGITSATAGIQEAVNSLPTITGGTVWIPHGTHNTYATVMVTGNYVTINGQGSASRIQANHNTGSVFYLSALGNAPGGPDGWQNTIKQLYIKGPASPGSLTAIRVRGQLVCRIIDNDIDGVFRGIWINDVPGDVPYGVTSAIFIQRNSILSTPANGRAITVYGGADHFIINNHMATGSANTVGFYLEASVGTKIIANEVYGFTVALLMIPDSGNFCSAIESIGNWYDSSQDDGVKLFPVGTGQICEIRFTDDRIAGSVGNGMAIFGTTANVLGVVISECLVSFNHGQGILYLGGTDVELNGCHVFANSYVSPGTNHGLNIAAGAGNIRVHGGTYAQSAPLPGSAPANTQGYGILIQAGAGDNIMIESAVVTPNIAGGISNGATGTSNVIRGNLGYNPIGQSSISVGSSPYTYTAGASPETVYIRGGTVSDVKVGGTTVATASPVSLTLYPNQAITVTYSVLPTMVADRQ